MTDTQFKIDTLDKDPFALDNLARPLPFRGLKTHKRIHTHTCKALAWMSVRQHVLNLP